MIAEKCEETNIDVLSEKIEMMRKELLAIGFREGFTASSTIEYSELLDKQIEVYQKIVSV